MCRGGVSEMLAVFLIAVLMLQGLEGAEEVCLFLNALASNNTWVVLVI